jgi:hypothetical protein
MFSFPWSASRKGTSRPVDGNGLRSFVSFAFYLFECDVVKGWFVFIPLRFAFLALLPLALVGCGKAIKPENAVPVYPVSGSLKWDGQPMAGAVITFHQTTAAPSARGVADETGKYTLTTYNTGDGAGKGDYAVTIHWPDGTVQPATDDPDPPLPPDKLQGAFTNSKTTTLKANVGVEPKVIDFNLTQNDRPTFAQPAATQPLQQGDDP